MAKIFIKPSRPGLLIRFPQNKKQILADDGEFVEHNREWQRKITFGDVVLASPKEADPKKVKAKTTEDKPEGESK